MTTTRLRREDGKRLIDVSVYLYYTVFENTLKKSNYRLSCNTFFSGFSEFKTFASKPFTVMVLWAIFWKGVGVQGHISSQGFGFDGA